MRNVMFWSIYLKPNRMKFGGMIGYYPGPFDSILGSIGSKVKVMNRSKSSWIAWNLVGWLVIIRGPLDFWISQVKGQGQGHGKVKIFFLP